MAKILSYEFLEEPEKNTPMVKFHFSEGEPKEFYLTGTGVKDLAEFLFSLPLGHTQHGKICHEVIEWSIGKEYLHV